MAANSFGFSGFTPLRHMAGGVIRANAYQILTSGTTGFNDNFYTGDMVLLNSDGTIEIGAAGSGATAIGIFAGCTYVASSDNTIKFAPNWPASTAVITGTTITAYVYDDPNITYDVTSDATTVVAQDMVGMNADHVVGTGSNFTGSAGSDTLIGYGGNAQTLLDWFQSEIDSGAIISPTTGCRERHPVGDKRRPGSLLEEPGHRPGNNLLSRDLSSYYHWLLGA